MRRNSNEKIIRLWTAVAVLTVALMFLFIAFGRQKSLSRIFFNAAGAGDKNEYCGHYSFLMNITKV